MLSQVSSLFFIEFGVGVLIFMLFMPLKKLKQTFFLLNGFIALFFLICSIVLFQTFLNNVSDSEVYSKQVLYFDSYRWITVVSSLILILSYITYVINQHLLSKVLLFFSVLFGVTAVISRGMIGVSDSLPMISQMMGGVSFLLGALLLGGCYGTMVLGHWYLTTPDLPFKYLIGSSRFLVITSVIRAIVLGLIMGLFFWVLGVETKKIITGIVSFNHFGLFFVMRVFWGIIGPLILSFMILETARLRNNQAATGILYVACVFVFIGELCASYIFHLGGFPL